MIDWQSGCCVMFRCEVLKNLNGFDGQFFYHFEEVDLCRRVWNAGYSILYTPEAVITHLGGQSVNRFPVRFELEKYRNRYRYFYKHFGPEGARRCRLHGSGLDQSSSVGMEPVRTIFSLRGLKNRMEMYRVTADWNKNVIRSGSSRRARNRKCTADGSVSRRKKSPRTQQSSN